MMENEVVSTFRLMCKSSQAPDFNAGLVVRKVFLPLVLNAYLPEMNPFTPHLV